MSDSNARRRLAKLVHAVEDRLERLAASAASGIAAMRLGSRRLAKAELRGRGCHCPPDLPLHLVHSEGLREGCDFVVDWDSNVGNPGRPRVPVERLAEVAGELGPGETVHVKTDRLGPFREHVLPRIRGPIVLVTGDSDASLLPHEALLASDKVFHWFAQSCDVGHEHPKLTRIPIGIDNPVFTKLEKRAGFLLGMLLGKTPLDPTLRRNDMGDQALLHRVRRESARPLRDRPPRVLCTFHQNNKFFPDLSRFPRRLEAVRLLRDHPSCHFVPRRLGQEECWRIHSDFAFELSPRGGGLDCLRTWECLFLETIPIVETSPLDALYRQEHLPVVIVGSFAEITAASLARWKEERQDRFGPDLLRRLSNDHWLEKIRAKQREARGVPT